ncbi:MAG TPA: sigma-70 family RNA polymerase sigma factor [Polyangiales bacterium]|nr:sigma-70 family RNA polymerase sigma factor [Polyangiales bacterium]
MEALLQIDGQLVRELSPMLVATAQRAVHRREDAEDMVQEMWLSALTSAGKFEGRSSARTWLHAILRRRIADSFRRVRPSTPFEDEQHVPDEDSEEQLQSRELAALALRMVPELGELERQALALCALDDLDRDQACAQLGITRGHLRVVLHRARKRLVELAA